MPRLEPARAADIDEIMRLERLPGNQQLVGRFEREEHEREFNLPGTRYLAWRGEDGALLGFAILQRFDNPHKNVNLRRIIVAEPGAGAGRAFLQALIDWFFEATDHNRLDLNVYVHNERAWRAYLREGFVEEGVQREIGIGWDGAFKSMKLMSILRSVGRPCRDAFRILERRHTSGHGPALRPRPLPRHRRRHPGAGGAREHRGGQGGRAAGLPPLLGGRAPQHRRAGLAGPGDPDRGPHPGDEPHPARLGRGDAGQLLAAEGRRGVHGAGGAGAGAHRPWRRPRAGDGSAHRRRPALLGLGGVRALLRPPGLLAPRRLRQGPHRSGAPGARNPGQSLRSLPPAALHALLLGRERRLGGCLGGRHGVRRVHRQGRGRAGGGGLPRLLPAGTVSGAAVGGRGDCGAGGRHRGGRAPAGRPAPGIAARHQPGPAAAVPYRRGGGDLPRRARRLPGAGRHRARSLAGHPAFVRARLEEKAAQTGADEVFVMATGPSLEARIRSLELIKG